MKIRPAIHQDAAQIAELMIQLGYPATQALIESKLAQFDARAIDAAFVAELEGQLVGVISCHITSLFHQEGSSGRITGLVIDQTHRGLGVGKSLVSEAENFFESHACVKSEVTSGEHRSEAHAFYESCRYKLDERRFIKHYGDFQH